MGADDAGRPRRDVRHPAQRPRGAAARRVRGPAGTGVDRPDDGPVRPRVADARESVRRPGKEPEALPRGSEMRPGRIEPIDDAYGPADDLPDLDVIVVSAERYPVAVALNEARAAQGLRPPEIRAVPMVLAQDGLPIASRRIRSGVIDRDGRRLTPVRVGVGTDNPVKVRP